MSNKTWLHRTYYLETLKVYARVWDIYIKFYTVFLTANVLGIGLVVAHIDENRWPIVVAFSIQNFITIFTSIGVALYSRGADMKLRQVAKHLLASDMVQGAFEEVVKYSPVAVKLSQLAGYANCLASVCMIGCWIALLFMPSQHHP